MAGKSKSSASKRIARSRKMKAMRRRRVGVLNQKKTDNYATIEETFSAGLTAGNTYNIYVQLNDLVRAQVLAKAYQYYRITKVVFKFKPLYDTFSTLGPSTIPQLYFMYDRSNTLPFLTAPQFEQVGVKAIRFDDKMVHKVLRPAVIGEANGNLPADYRISPWLPCNTDTTGGYTLSAVEHQGVVALITKMYPTDATVYDTDIIVTVQFKSPLVPGSSESTHQVKMNAPRGHFKPDGSIEV